MGEGQQRDVASVFGFAPRTADVLRLRLRCLGVERIAELLDKSRDTVKTQLRRIHHVLRVNSHGELGELAHEALRIYESNGHHEPAELIACAHLNLRNRRA